MNDEVPAEDNTYKYKMRKTYEKAFAIFLDKLEAKTNPINFPLSFEICEDIRRAQWSIPFIDEMVAWDLTETINQLNAWAEWLRCLSIWIEVLDHFDEQNAWNIQLHYVDPLAHICLMEPSSTRDRFGHIATQAIHQANLSTIDNYKDHLKQDEPRRQLQQGNPKSKPRKNDDRKRLLYRPEVEDQIVTIGAKWVNTTSFLQNLKRLDDKDYRKVTTNYRNLASHAIAPRFKFGYTNMVVRSIEPVEERIPNTDGTYSLKKHPTKKVVQYGFGGTKPLDLSELHKHNQAQLNQAISVYNAYNDLMKEILSALEQKAHNHLIQER